MSNTPSEEEILALAQQHLKAFAQFSPGGVWFEGEVEFARAVEAEVRKQDDALILQLVEALENSHATLWEEDDDPARPVHAAIIAGRARISRDPSHLC